MPSAWETVVTKQYARALYGTSLAATLTASGIDTLFVCGLTTAGHRPVADHTRAIILISIS
jgi:maleamate amidohydrolase